MSTFPYNNCLSKLTGHYLWIVSLIVMVVLGMILVSPVYAAGPVVDTAVDENDGSCVDGDCSLRDAIDTANDGDIITFSDDFNIYLDSTIYLPYGDSLSIDGDSQVITISGDSGNDGTRDVSIFYIQYSSVVTLTNLNIVSGTGFSGAIYNEGTLTINDSTIFDNETSGIKNNGTATINDSTISGNQTSYRGGGIYNTIMATVTINRSTISGNQAEDGGGIFTNGTLTINRSTISGNQAEDGGGIYSNNSDSLTINNSTLSGNEANFVGSISSINDNLTINNSTVFTNHAITGTINGIYMCNTTLNLRNTIIANGSDGLDCYVEEGCSPGGTIATNTHNLIEDGTCSPDYSGDPLLASLHDYGGDTSTIALLPGSPAIDAGDSPACTDVATINSLDQRGIARPSACDIGAFESQGFALSITGGNDQTAKPLNSFSAPLEVTYVATDTNLIVGAGQIITFTAPSVGASVTTGTFTATTNSSSVASVIVTANSVTGTYEITATAREAENFVMFTLTNGISVYLPIVVKDN